MISDRHVENKVAGIMNSNAYKQTSFKIGSNALASMDIVFKQLNGLNN
jgi:hypothetical protein